ncbi:MAG: sulfate/molybdate ABC transporter ATP-binding protein [Leptolyngbya sp.]|nr:sulfate/molybdate ABC transporter ATP-binding protein [Leptolyngbya sp.]
MALTVEIQKQLSTFTLSVAFRAEATEILGLLGPSGSGKSMTLHCIAGIETPDQGRIVLNQRILYDSSLGINLPSRQRRVGYLFQSYALFPHLTVAQNVAYGLRGWSRAATAGRVADQLQQFQLTALAHHYPGQLSGGEQQRVALARALAPDPDILLLDEPFSALDAHLRSELERRLTTTLAHYSGLTLFVSHHLEEAYRVCPQWLVLDQGRALAQGPRQQIFDHPTHVAVAQITGCKNLSRISPKNAHTLHALDWNCTLTTADPIRARHTHIGLRAHRILLGEMGHGDAASEIPAPPNTLPAWVAWQSETPDQMTLYLKLGEPATDPQDYHLQAQIDRDRWHQRQSQPMPWWVHLPPDQILLLQGQG